MRPKADKASCLICRTEPNKNSNEETKKPRYSEEMVQYKVHGGSPVARKGVYGGKDRGLEPAVKEREGVMDGELTCN